MGRTGQSQAVKFLERRMTLRSRVSCPAVLHLPTRRREVCLWDLSERGARVQMDDPPRDGTSVLLEWLSHDVAGKIAWTTGDMCGVVFDRPVSPGWVLDAMQHREEFTGPVAEVTRIPLGTRRGFLRG